MSLIYDYSASFIVSNLPISIETIANFSFLRLALV
jgi:hypothetical protein